MRTLHTGLETQAADLLYIPFFSPFALAAVLLMLWWLFRIQASDEPMSWLAWIFNLVATILTLLWYFHAIVFFSFLWWGAQLSRLSAKASLLVWFPVALVSHVRYMNDFDIFEELRYRTESEWSKISRIVAAGSITLGCMLWFAPQRVEPFLSLQTYLVLTERLMLPITAIGVAAVLSLILHYFVVEPAKHAPPAPSEVNRFVTRMRLISALIFLISVSATLYTVLSILVGSETR